MPLKLRRTFVALGLLTSALVTAVVAAPSVGADPDLDINWVVDAQTHIARLNQDISVTGAASSARSTWAPATSPATSPCRPRRPS